MGLVCVQVKLETMLGDDAVLLLPTHPTTAPVHGMPCFRVPNFAYTAIFNVLEMAVTAVPTGFADDGMPTGVQVCRSLGRGCAPLGCVLCTGVWVCDGVTLVFWKLCVTGSLTAHAFPGSTPASLSLAAPRSSVGAAPMP